MRQFDSREVGWDGRVDEFGERLVEGVVGFWGDEPQRGAWHGGAWFGLAGW